MEMRNYITHANAVKKLYHDVGAAGRPCPKVPKVTPTMPPDDVRLLIHAWTLRNFPMGVYTKQETAQVDDLMLEFVKAWQDGAKEGNR